MNNLFQSVVKRSAHFGKTKEKECPLIVSGIPPHSKEGSYKLYKNLFYFVGVPLIALATLNAILAKKIEEEGECGGRPPFVKYEYLRRRTKRFPWGDGQRTLFHNPRVNPLPDGYEDEE
ncbi:cytochrome c oxidase subunit 6A1, mitochondrial [Leptinotarsa decemlineata]|uniref:cytochrome c oxidase subunit 6A1, mitochondrial n=1 Tax=Leptinotarsa decemlineata TaxID=7539 RepID=UPI000C25574D|nr:cytochrome c oxidase subunit 6A1, mitochondrial-like [Leptinotarsa decemlineata]